MWNFPHQEWNPCLIMPPAVEAQNLNHWTTGEVPQCVIINLKNRMEALFLSFYHFKPIWTE